MIDSEEYALEVGKAAAESFAKESADKIAKAIGNIFPFFGVKRQAITTYIEDIQNSDLPPEEKMFAIANAKQTFKRIKNQKRIAEIAYSSAADGTDFSENSDVDDEWLERFMDSAKFVSDEQMQVVWGNILAGEFENPNSTPPSVTRILSEITPTYAKAFQILCSLAVTILGESNDRTIDIDKPNTRIILPTNYSYLEDYGLDFSVLNELQMLGLIQFNPVTGYVLKFDNITYPKLHIIYGKKALTVLQYKQNAFPRGIVILTQAGQSIAKFTEQRVIEEHLDNISTYLKEKNVVISDVPEITVK